MSDEVNRMSDDEYHRGIFGAPAPSYPMPEWVKLIPAGSIPVFCFSPETFDQEVHRAREQLRDFFGARKVLVIRGDVQIYAIADQSGVSTEGASWAIEAQS